MIHFNKEDDDENPCNVILLTTAVWVGNVVTLVAFSFNNALLFMMMMTMIDDDGYDDDGYDDDGNDTESDGNSGENQLDFFPLDLDKSFSISRSRLETRDW